MKTAFDLSLLNTVKACIFDVDGTLLDSMPVWHDLGARFLLSKGIEPAPDLQKKLYPLSLKEAADYLSRYYPSAGSPDAILNSCLAMLRHFYLKEVLPKPGIPALLKELSLQKYPMVIATSGDRQLVKGALNRLGLLSYFSAILTCSELNTTKKEPVIFMQALKILEKRLISSDSSPESCGSPSILLPREVLVFEDSLLPVRTARAAGFSTLAVEDPSSGSDREEIIRTANWYVRDFL